MSSGLDALDRVNAALASAPKRRRSRRAGIGTGLDPAESRRGVAERERDFQIDQELARRRHHTPRPGTGPRRGPDEDRDLHHYPGLDTPESHGTRHHYRDGPERDGGLGIG